MSGKKVILGVTAGIAAYKAAEIIRLLRDSGFKVTVVMTEDAQRFITPLSLAVLSGNKVYSGMFDQPKDWDIEHISLAETADIILVAPATADIIAKLSGGLCGDLLNCVILASKAPVLIAPAMNDNMYKHPITRENISRLKKIGYKFIGPARGKLASGKVGLGRLADVEEIVKEAKKILAT